MTTRLRSLTLSAGLWLAAVVARADVPPPPARPDWQDTPLPMPEEPTILLAALVAVIVVVVAHLVARARTR